MQQGPIDPLVLVVDDDPLTRRLMGDILGESGFRVVLASNGREALFYLANGPPPSVILCGLAMPAMNTREFCERKRADARLAPIPVVVISDRHPMVQAPARSTPVPCSRNPCP